MKRGCSRGKICWKVKIDCLKLLDSVPSLGWPHRDIPKVWESRDLELPVGTGSSENWRILYLIKEIDVENTASSLSCLK